MTTGPGLFSDIGRKAKDLLTRDYISDHKLLITTYSATGVALTSSAVKKGSLSTADVGVQYKYRDAFIDVKLDTDSNVLTTITLIDAIPSTKTIATLKYPDYNSGKFLANMILVVFPYMKVEVQYFHQNATLSAASTLKQSPAIDLSATLGTPTFAFGAEASYETSSGTLTKYNAGISVTKPESSASIILGDKGDSIRASYVHHLDQLKRSTGVAEITRRFSTNENTFTVGGSYVVDPLTVIKFKLNNHGNLGTVFQHELIPKSILTISSEFDTKALDKTPRFGVALALKP